MAPEDRPGPCGASAAPAPECASMDAVARRLWYDPHPTMRSMRSGCYGGRVRTPAVLALILAAVPTSAHAQSVACGIDCADRSYRSCNDSVSLSGGALPISCSASAGSCQGEVFCASLGHQLPASAFPVDIEEILLVAADAQASAAAMPFDLIVYEERGTALPGPQVGPIYNLSLPGSQSAAIRIDLTSSGFSPIRVSTAGPFRVCLRKQFDGGHNVCLDTNGSAASDRNWTFVRVAANPANPCGSVLIPGAWYEASGVGSPLPGFPGLQGDFILRAKVRPNQLTGVPGWAGCTGADAGMGDAAPSDAMVMDAAPSDSGPTDADASDAAPEDLGPVDALTQDVGPTDARPADTGALDASDLMDAEAGDAQASDAAEADGGGLPPPTITAVNPTQAPVDAPIPLLVTGEGFVEGLRISVGPQQAEGVTVSGGTTAQGVLAAGLATGTYAVVIQNPDGQAAILPSALVIIGDTSPPNPPATDNCAATGSSPSWLALLGGLFFLGRRRHRGARR